MKKHKNGKMKYYDEPFDILYIEWDDACGNAEWFTPKETLEWLKESKWIVCECGFLIAEDKYAIYLAGRLKQEDEFSDRKFGALQRIPKNWIKKRVKVKP